MRLSILLPALALLTLPPALAAAGEGTPTSAEVRETAALEAALGSVSLDHISADIHFLASDALAGRDTPSLGLQIAARYIRSRLQSIGFQPGAKDGFFFEYELEYKRLDPDATKLVLGGRELAFGEDYYGYFRSDEALEIAAAAVFVGPETEGAFAAAGVEGKWAITVETEDTRWREVRRLAQDAGALGVVRVLSAESEKEIPRRHGRYVQQLLEGRVSYPSGREPRERDPSYPFLYMTQATFEQAANRKLEELNTGTALEGELRDVRVPRDDGGRVTLENVCGFWPGSDPELSKEVIILSAHYDHVGTDGEEIYNGADDNGSGTTGLLALSEALVAYGPLRRSVMLIWVSGEEKGLLGSRAWAENPWLPEGCKPVLNINIDMIGRNAPEKLMITPTSKHRAYNGLTRLAESLAPEEGFPELGDADAYYGRSDQYNFEKYLKIPIAFLFTDVHEDYHQPTDTPDKIDVDKIRRVVRLVMRMLDGLQADELDL